MNPPAIVQRLLGIDPSTVVTTPANRPVKLLAEDAPVIKESLAESGQRTESSLSIIKRSKNRQLHQFPILEMLYPLLLKMLKSNHHSKYWWRVVSG